MRTAMVVFRREMGAFFDSPMAYVVAIGFLLLNSALYVLDLWAAHEASLRGFFEWVSWSACFIVPAITMRSWADERKGATFELLLTFPAHAAWIVLGKFLAALAFYATCLASSLVLPASLKLLSVPGLQPDWGAILAGYLGSLLMGALLIAVGMFLSALCRDQIEAYIVTLVCVLALRLFGFAPIAGQIDSVIPRAGTFLRDMVSFSTPHGRFVAGLVGLGDLAFHLAWIAGFLLLNAVFVEESRLRPGSRVRKLGAAALGIPVVILAGSLALELSPRADLTADRIYTVSDAAAEILQQVPEDQPLRVQFYVSPKSEMPAFMTTLERDVLERFDALKRRAKGRLVVDVVHLHADDAVLRAQELLQQQLTGEPGADNGKEGTVEEKLIEEGIVPFRVGSGGLTGTETKVVYAALALTQGANRKEVIPQVMPGELGSIEKELLTRAFRMVKKEKPVVGVLAPITAVDIDPQQLQILAQLGMPMDQIAREQDDYRMIPRILGQAEQYEVRRLRPDADQPLPEGMRTLVVVQPGALSDRLKWEIRRFVHGGGSLIVAVQPYEYGLVPMRGGVGPRLERQETGVSDLLSAWGVAVPAKMVMSDQSTPLTYAFGFGQQATVDYPWSFRLDQSSFHRDLSLSDGLGNFVLIQAAGPVEKDDAKLKELGLRFTPVLSAGATSWTREVPMGPPPEDIVEPRPGEGPIPLAALVEGQFPPPGDPPAPADGEPAAPAPPVEAKPGRLLVVGTATPFRDDQIASQQGLSWSGVLVKNAVDALSLSDLLLRLKVHQAVARPLKEVDRSTMLTYEVVMIGLAPALIALAGVLRLLARRRRQQQPFRPSAPGPSAPAPPDEAAA